MPRKQSSRWMRATTFDAGADMAIGRDDDGDDRSHPNSDDWQSNVKGIFFLLLSARASLLRLEADDACTKILDDCIAAFQTQYNLTDQDTKEGIVWEETSMAALLRLLEYLHGEISEGLNDRRCAERLKTCIERLRQATGLRA